MRRLIFITLMTLAICIFFYGLPQMDKKTVYDSAKILTPQQIDSLTQYHAKLLEAYDIDYRVTTLNLLQEIDINLVSHQLFVDRKVGEFSQSGRGILLVVDAKGHKLRLEISAALSPVYTDAFLSYIEHRQMIPFFKAGRVSDGILATSEMMFTRAQEATQRKAFMPPRESISIGAGATNDAEIGSGYVADYKAREGVGYSKASNSPEGVMGLYMASLEARDASPYKRFFTLETQLMMSKWTVTAAQMDNEARNIKQCLPGRTFINGDFAVIRFAITNRQCVPYFFHTQNGRWALDLTMMQKAIRFNHENAWHFDEAYPYLNGPYSFAFADLIFDRNGYPFERKNAAP
tara:strand:- start:212186 stop:213229 length:1044 start_codon:yes stop_codon:yes gene_type:complete